MRRIAAAFAVMALACTSLWAQSPVQGTDPQLRILNHVQRFGQNSKVGFAFWGVVPNVVKTDPLKGLLVGGIAFRSEDKKQSIEFMGGAFVDTKGFIDPVVDMRFVVNRNKHFGVTGQLLRAFRAHRTLLSGTATTPLPFARKLKLCAGGESDVNFDLAGAHAGFGPRISGTQGKLTVAVAFQKGLLNQRDVLRIYALFNW